LHQHLKDIAQGRRPERSKNPAGFYAGLSNADAKKKTTCFTRESSDEVTFFTSYPSPNHKPIGTIRLYTYGSISNHTASLKEISMRKIVFDIETRNIFSDVGKNDPALLDISILGAYDSETDEYNSYTVEELPQFWPILERADLLIGYNSDHFDIPILNKYYPGDITHIKSLDLMVEVKQSLGRRLRLDSIAEGTLGINKSGHGLQAYEWWKKGEVEKIRKYCVDDVRITKEIFDYACAHKSLKYKDVGAIRDIALDTSLWETLGSKPAMTHTLPF
jgi:DEAD/DEAH box helicase domain-containing protein